MSIEVQKNERAACMAELIAVHYRKERTYLGGSGYMGVFQRSLSVNKTTTERAAAS